MVQKKKAGKKHNSLSTCISCHSPHLKEYPLGKNMHYICSRCGKVHKQTEQKSLSQSKVLHKHRKTHFTHSQKHIRGQHNQNIIRFLSNFHLRMIFKILGTAFLALGIVLMPSNDLGSGILFFAIGFILLYAGVTYL